MSSRREEMDIDEQALDAADDHGESAVQSEGAKQRGPMQKGDGPIDLVESQMGDQVDPVIPEEAAVSDVGSAETADSPDPAAQRVRLFASDGGTQVYGVKTEYERYLPVTALVVPLDPNADRYEGVARSLEREMPLTAWKRLASEFDRFASDPLKPDAPALIPLDVSDLPEILPNAPTDHAEQPYALIAATTNGVQRPEELREAASAIVRTAHEAGVTELGVLPLGAERGPFKNRPAEIASQMVHGIWAALLDLPESPLREITFATRDEDALHAAHRKSNLLTRNVPQQIWGDQPAEKDLLGIKHEAEALAESLLLRQVLPPLAVGILGGWGSGKSTVMRLMMKRMTRARTAGVKAGWNHDNAGEAPTRVGHIYQIRFNAWTYAKSNLWASLMQTIFWELNRQLTVEQRLIALKRAEGLTALDGGEEFQFLYDPFARLDNGLWLELSQKVRAALQDESDRNVLWQQLRAKHRLALETLQEKEKEIARLKARREEVEVRRRAEIMRDLGQESQMVAYRMLRRRSRALLGEMYEGVMNEVNSRSQTMVAGELRLALQEITEMAGDLGPVTGTLDTITRLINEDGLRATAGEDVTDAEEGDEDAEARRRERIEALKSMLVDIVSVANAAATKIAPDYPAAARVLTSVRQPAESAQGNAEGDAEAKKILERLEEATREVQDRAEGARALFAELGKLPSETRDAVETSQNRELGEQVAALQQELAKNQNRVRDAYQQVPYTATPVLEPLAALLEEVERPARRALALNGAEARVDALYAEARGLRIRWRKVWEAGGKRPKWAVPVLVVGLVLVGIAAALVLLGPGWPTGVVPALASGLTVGGSLFTLLRPPLKVAAEWGGRVGALVDDYQQEAEAERQRRQDLIESRLAEARAEDEQELQTFLAVAGVAPDGQAREGAGLGRRPLPHNLADIDRRIERLETEAEELRRETGPPAEFESLLDFVQARQDDQFYEKQLGLMHQVKRDIDVLTGGLVSQPEDDPAVVKAKQELFPRGPARVVLYIDDLDRCPPNRVVEVLEAVQLLLNTELFVVVLGLDTRYITRALEKEYREILQPDGDPSGLDYIEKILQLPYRVRPIDEKSLKGFLDEQMDLAIGAGERPDRPGEGGNGVGEVHHEEEEGEPVNGRGGGGGAAQEGAPALPELPPEVIKFQPEDRDDLETCCRQLALTPRNVKRLVNVLKLINVFWFRTGGDLRDRPIKRTVVGLLALSAGYPEIMREAFAQMIIKYRDQSEAESLKVGQFLSDLSLPGSLSEQRESLHARFRADIDVLYEPEPPRDPFLDVTLAKLELRTFNLVRSFSFVGDPVYLGNVVSERRGELSPPNVPSP